MKHRLATHFVLPPLPWPPLLPACGCGSGVLLWLALPALTFRSIILGESPVRDQSGLEASQQNGDRGEGSWGRSQEGMRNCMLGAGGRVRTRGHHMSQPGAAGRPG